MSRFAKLYGFQDYFDGEIEHSEIIHLLEKIISFNG